MGAIGSMRTLAGRPALAIAAVLLLTPLGHAYTVSESWEGAHTVLGMYGTGDPPIFADVVACEPPGAVDGSRTLRLVHNSPTGTPTAYVAWVTGLGDGDIVSASIWRYDVTPGTSPSCRLGAHWNDNPVDIDTYSGAAGWNEDAGAGHGWDEVSWDWVTCDGHIGLVIEVRVYSDPGDTVWVDAMTVSAPDHAWILVPEPPMPVRNMAWSKIKALYRDSFVPEVPN